MKPWSEFDLSRYTLAPEDYERLGKLRDEIALCLRDMQDEALLALRLTIAETELLMTERFGSACDLEVALRAKRERGMA